MAWLVCLGLAYWGGDDAIVLKEALAAGATFQIKTREELTGSLTLPADTAGGPPRKIPITAQRSVHFGERVLAVSGDGAPAKTLRWYLQADLDRKVGPQSEEQHLRLPARRIVLWRDRDRWDAFSPEVPLLLPEIQQALADVSLPALGGLLPAHPVRVQATWTARADAVRALTGLLEIKEGSLTCRFQEIQNKGDTRLARVSFAGTLLGTTADGPNRQKLDGYFLFDLNAQQIGYLYLMGTSWLLNEKGDTAGELQGRFIFTRTNEPTPELADAALTGAVLEPTPHATRVQFAEPALGVEFAYPRTWRVRQADARQIILDAPDGVGLMMTLEPLSQWPSLEPFRREALAALAKQKLTPTRQEAAARLRGEPAPIDRFGLECRQGQEMLWLDYYLAKHRAGGAILAVRGPLRLAAATRAVTDQLVLSLRLDPPTPGKE